MPLPRNSEQPPIAQRPRFSSPSSVCSSAWAPASQPLPESRIRRRARHRVSPGGEIACRPPQEPRLNPSVAIQDQDHVALAHLRLGGRQRRALAVRQALSAAPDHAGHVGDAVRQGRFPGRIGGAIRRPVVDHDQFEERRVVRGAVILAADVAHESPEYGGFVASSHDNAERGPAHASISASAASSGEIGGRREASATGTTQPTATPAVMSGMAAPSRWRPTAGRDPPPGQYPESGDPP